MKFRNFLSLVLILSLNFSVFGQGINFFHGTFDEAVKEAKAKNKLIFMDAYASWCGPCKWMSSTVFTTKEVGDFHNANFINLKVDMEKGEGPSLRSKYPLRAYPTLFWIDPNSGKKVHEFVGGAPPETLIAQGNVALKGFDSSADLKKKYDEGNHDAETVYALIKSMNRQGIPSQKITNDYLLKAKDKTDSLTLKIIHEGTLGIDSKAFELLMANRGKITNLLGKNAVSEKIGEACRSSLNRAAEFQDKNMLKAIKDIYSSEKLSDIPCFEKEADFIFNSKSPDKSLNAESSFDFIKSCSKDETTAVTKLIALNSTTPQGSKTSKNINALMIKIGKKSKDEVVLGTIADWFLMKKDKKYAVKFAESAVKINKKSAKPSDAYQKLLDKSKSL